MYWTIGRNIKPLIFFLICHLGCHTFAMIKSSIRSPSPNLRSLSDDNGDGRREREKSNRFSGCLHRRRKIQSPGRSLKEDHPSVICFLYSVCMQKAVLIPSTRSFLASCKLPLLVVYRKILVPGTTRVGRSVGSHGNQGRLLCLALPRSDNFAVRYLLTIVKTADGTKIAFFVFVAFHL